MMLNVLGVGGNKARSFGEQMDFFRGAVVGGVFPDRV